MSFGVTSTGFSLKRQTDIVDNIATKLHKNIDPNLQVKAAEREAPRTFIGNLTQIFSEELADAWEALQEAYNAYDPDNAGDYSKKALAAITGVRPDPATRGRVVATVNLDAGSYSAGELVAHVTGDATNLWENESAVTTSTTGDVNLVFVSQVASSAAIALASTLTVIASPVSGWNTITNAQDATAGTDEQTLDSLMVEREESLARAGSATPAAIKADVEAVKGVLEVRVFRNPTIHPVGTLPAKTTRVVVWDGEVPAADNTDSTNALVTTAGAGTRLQGAISNSYPDITVNPLHIAFDRAVKVDVYINVTVQGLTASSDAIKAELLKMFDYPTLTIGEELIYQKLKCAPFNVANVTDVTAMTIGLTASPTGQANLTLNSDQRFVSDSSKITVTKV